MYAFPIDLLCIDETKLTSDFPTAQFRKAGYQYPPFRRDRVNIGNLQNTAGEVK